MSAIDVLWYVAAIYVLFLAFDTVIPAIVVFFHRREPDQPIPGGDQIAAKTRGLLRGYRHVFRRGMTDPIAKQQREQYYREKVTIDPRD
jgi:hypothetical protein